MPLLSPDQHCRSTETIQWKYKNSKDKIVANHQRSCGPVVSLSPAFLKCPTALLVSVHLCSQCSSPDLDYFWSSQLSYRHRKFILLHFNNWTAACMHSRTCTHTHTHSICIVSVQNIHLNLTSLIPLFKVTVPCFDTVGWVTGRAYGLYCLFVSAQRRYIAP